MSATDDLKNLSKEELLALLHSVRQELVASQKQVATLDKKTQRLEAKNQKLDARNQKLDTQNQKLNVLNKELDIKNKELKHQLQVAKELTLNHLELVAQMTKEAHYRVVVLDEYIARPLLEQLQSVFEESREWLHDAITYRAQCYATGNDVKNDKSKDGSSQDGPAEDAPDPTAADESATANDENASQNKEDASANDDADKPKTQEELLAEAKKLSNNCLDKIDRSVSRLINDATNVVKSLPEGMIGACGGNVKEIYNTPAPEHKSTSPNPSKGRQETKFTPEREADGTSDTGTHKCPTCGRPMDPFTHGSVTHKFVTKMGKLDKIIEGLQHVSSLEICPHCHEVHGFFDKNEDLPIKPNRSIGQKFCLDACTHTYMGIPLTRMAAMVKMVTLFGHSTVSENYHAFIRDYLKPLYDCIIEYAKKAKYIMADGTPFTCLEKQGKGSCSKSKKGKKKAEQQQTEGESNAETELSCEDEIAISNYVLSFCNVPMAKELFTCYAFLPTRSAKSIEKVLTEDFSFDTLICDAFQGYDTIAAKRKAIIQNCLTHLRRYNVNDARPDELAEELEALSEEQRQAFIKEQFQKGGDRMLLFTTYVALSKIYALEGSVDCTAPDAIEKIIEVRKTEKVIMDHFTAIMDEMVRRKTVLSKNGKKLKRKKGAPYSSFPFYWYQHRDNFLRYLNDPMIPPDTNMVEQCIRPLTILRKNTNFMTSIEGMEDRCIVYTIWATLKKNGIDDPAAYLQQYCRDLFTHCYDRNYTIHFFGLNGKKMSDPEQLNKKLITWDFQALSQGFNFKKYLPFLND